MRFVFILPAGEGVAFVGWNWVSARWQGDVVVRVGVVIIVSVVGFSKRIAVVKGDLVDFLFVGWVQGWQGSCFAQFALAPDQRDWFSRSCCFLPVLQQIRDFAGVEGGVVFFSGGAGAAANALQIFVHVSCLQEIAVCDAAAVLSYNATAGGAVANGTGVVAVFDGAAVIPHNAADATIAAGDSDAAGVVAVFDGATVVPPHNAAGISAIADVADVVAVCNAAAVPPHNAADVVVSAGDGAADVADVVAVFHGAAVIPHNAAAVVAGVVAVFDGAAVPPTTPPLMSPLTLPETLRFCTLPLLPTKPKRP